MLVQIGAFGFQFLDLRHYSVDIDRLFLLERINVARNVEVIIVFGDFL